ncbi:unknown [Bacteroides sp. CAG:770]|nr:unknown [Bacteroides sp. CAG:770]
MFLSWGNPDKITYEDYAGKINDKKASTELTDEANILGYISMFTFSRVRNPGR